MLMNDVKQHCCPCLLFMLCCVAHVFKVVQARSPWGSPGTCQHQGQVCVHHHGASRDSDHSDMMTPEENKALCSLMVKTLILQVLLWPPPKVSSVPWRSGKGAALLPEQVEDSILQGIPSTCSAAIWPLKQTSACKTIQLQVINRINFVMLQSEPEHVIHYSSIRGLIRTRLIRVHHCLKLSTKKMF